MTLEELEERIKVLERRLFASKRRRDYLLIILLIILALMATILVGGVFVFKTVLGRGEVSVQDVSGEEIIRARGFEVIDSDGYVRAEMSMVGESPRLRLWTKDGDGRVELSVVDESPMLRFFDVEGELRAEVSLSEGSPVMKLYDERGGSVRLGVLGGYPELELTDEIGREVFSVH